MEIEGTFDELPKMASAMNSITFMKYSVYGNNFVLIDEIEESQLAESEKSDFAHIATDHYFGIGSDNLIILQKYSSQALEKINLTRSYWDKIPIVGGREKPDYLFRMFEPDGREAFSCGNGLLCASHYLDVFYGVQKAGIITEIPSPTPKLLTVSAARSPRSYRVNMGYPSMVPDSLIHPSVMSYKDQFVGMIRDFPISFQMAVTKKPEQEICLKISGYLTYTGEPHLVILSFDEESSSKELLPISETILDDKKMERNSQKHRTNSVWLLHQIGSNFNGRNSHLFPHGLNVNFARIVSSDEGIIEYRCFERGIRKETLACGTGATAIAVVAHRIGAVKTDHIRLRPIRCRWYYPDAQQLAIRDSQGMWWLEGEPGLIFSGTVEFPTVLTTDKTIYETSGSSQDIFSR